MQVSTIGLDIAKNVFQVHGVDGQGRTVLRRQVRRNSCCSYSVVCILALSASRRARRRTIGPANSAPSGTRCG